MGRTIFGSLFKPLHCAVSNRKTVFPHVTDCCAIALPGAAWTEMQTIEANSQTMVIAQMEALERRNSLHIPLNPIPEIPPGGPWILYRAPSVP